ncbi:MAG: VOC family protein [Ignavibacteria bacterium]|nr:VOC family protein [Ignavibacteria bacterium]
MELNQVTLPALSIADSVRFYRAMGFELIVNELHYARFKSTVGNATFSVHAVDVLGKSQGFVLYFECESLDEHVTELQSKGFVFSQEPQDETWLWREARLTDPSGNEICLYYAGENRLNPPWRVKE